MNLLFVAYSIVQGEGGSLPIDMLVNKINTGKQFKKADNSPITKSELTDLIQNYGKNIQVNFEGEVKTLYAPEKPISLLYWNIIELLRSSGAYDEIAGITILFYARVSQNAALYLFDDLRLTPFRHFRTLENPKEQLIEELKKLNKHQVFDGKLKAALNYIHAIDDRVLQEIIYKIESFDISDREISAADFAIQFQDLFLNVDRFSQSITFIPEFIREIICELALAKPFHTLYNPVIGVGEVFTSIYSQLDTANKVQFIGDSTFDIYGFTGTMNLILHQFQNFQISTNNPLINSSAKPHSIDCIICQPPFGGQSSINDWQLNADYLRFGRSSRMETLFLQFVLNILNDMGRAFIILPEGFMISESVTDRAIRKYLLEKDFVDSVISLPAGAYENSRIRTNILCIDKNKTQDRKGRVTFFDSFSSWVSLFDKSLITDIAHGTAKRILKGPDHEMMKETVSVQDIIENNYRLQVSLYVNSYSKKIRNIIAHDENVVKISAVLDGTKFRSIAEECEMPYIKGGDLSKDTTDPYLKISEIRSLTKVNGKVIDKSSVLVAKIGGSLNPTIFKFAGDPIVINQNVFVLPPDEKRIDLEYLALELNSELVREQLLGKLTGTAMQYYNYADLLNVQIRLPELVEQKKRVSVYQDQILAAKKKETLLLAEKMSSQEDEINVLSAMKHSFAQLPFQTDLSNIETYLNRKITTGELISWDDYVSPSPKSRSIKGVFEGLNRMIDSTNELFQNMENLINCDPNRMKVENIKIHDFISATLQDLDNLEGISVLVDGINIPVRIDTYQFTELIKNFVINAIRHGFENTDKPKVIFFHTSISEGNWFLTISNNGAPFPDDFSIKEFTAFGKRRLASKGTGIGGYIIDKVIKNHQGKFSINDRKKLAEVEMKKLTNATAGISKTAGFPVIYTVEFVLEFPFNFKLNA